jgi:hypothetical protein
MFEFLQLLENSVKRELLGRCEHIQVVVEDESQRAALNLQLRRSASVACGAWVGQVRDPYGVKLITEC